MSSTCKSENLEIFSKAVLCCGPAWWRWNLIFLERYCIYSCSLGFRWMWDAKRRHLYCSVNVPCTRAWGDLGSLSPWLCHHSCGLGRVNFPLRVSVPLYKPWDVDSMSSNILWFYMFLLLNYEELIFFYFKVITTPNPHGICSALYFCEGWQAFCAVFGVTGTISFSFQLLSSSCHSTKEVFATMVKGDLWLSSFGSHFKCSSENFQSSSSGSVPHLELDGVHGSCLLLFLAALGERTSGLSGSRIRGGAWKGERFL